MLQLLPNIHRVHMIGIGGSGMSGLARLLSQTGVKITGSDQNNSPTLEKLQQEKIKVYPGHDPKNISSDVEMVIYSAAVSNENPELKEAKKLSLPIYSYPEAIGMLTKQIKTIAVCGTHGKTTTTAMAAVSFLQAKKDPTVIVGAPVAELGNINERLGKSEYFILESCEYKRAFLNYSPEIIILTNIEADHLDYYQDLEDYKKAFSEFIAKLPKNGLLIANIDDENVRDICKDLKNVEIAWFGKNSKANYQLKENTIYYKEKKLVELNLFIPGEHNLMNASAVIALAHQLNLPLNEVKLALENYHGASRRFEYKGKIGKTILIDDYAHHPTEIKVTLKAAREKYGKEAKILCIFQPHQYSRTYKLLDGFLKAFSDVDEVIVPNILEARDLEDDLKNIDGKKFAKLLQKRGKKAAYGDGIEKTSKSVQKRIPEFDVILTMGAGDVWKIAEYLTKNI